jgi:hypothetical protein
VSVPRRLVNGVASLVADRFQGEALVARGADQFQGVADAKAS